GEKTLASCEKSWTLQARIHPCEGVPGILLQQGGSLNIEEELPDPNLLWRSIENQEEGSFGDFLGLPKESFIDLFDPFEDLFRGNSVCALAQTGTWRQCLAAKISILRPAILPSNPLNSKRLPLSSSGQNSDLFFLDEILEVDKYHWLGWRLVLPVYAVQESSLYCLAMASRGRRGGAPAREDEPRCEERAEQQAPAPQGPVLPPPPPVDYGVFMQGLVEAMQTQAHTQAALQVQLEAQV
ncbi:hypothetical protein Taro_011740, partial [Colocasia esculenta]|nr:hypothetical protein [Colocasia esculenta]